MTQNGEIIGEKMHKWATDLFPICRSLSGDGVRDTLRYLQQELPELKIESMPSATQVFDWQVPDEWNIKDAFIADENGNRVIDFKDNNLHVMGYSEPIDTQMSFSELDDNLHSLPDQPTAIPYVTSYYKRRWGFCISQQQRDKLRQSPDARYHVKIDSELKAGELNYGDCLIKGDSDDEILLSTYICHPSMANNELSGPVMAIALAQWLKSLPKLRYSYRIIFAPETIGAIIYLSKHLQHLQQHVKAGFILTCVGDERAYSFMPSRTGNTLADRTARHVLSHHAPEYISYNFLQRGSDERQYCAPKIDLPICSIMRSKYAEYPEYHTSLDDLSLITPSGLQGGFEAIQKALILLEANQCYEATCYGEPQLGKRGLYPDLSTKDSGLSVRRMMNILAYADGKTDLIELAETIEEDALLLLPTIEQLMQHDLLKAAAK